MLHLLSLEWQKFKDNSLVLLFALMFVITFSLTILLGKDFDQIPKFMVNMSEVFQFPKIWDYQAYIGSWLIFFFLGYITIYIVTAEVQFKTLRQNIITGMSRQDYFLSKLYSVIVISLFSTLIYGLICLLIGYFHNDPSSFAGAFDNNNAMLRFFILNMGYMSFALMLAFVIRRTGLAIFAYYTYILFVEQIGKMTIQGQSELGGQYANYLPLNAIEDLARFPPFELVENLPNKLPYEFFLSHGHAMIFGALYTVLFIGLAYWSFVKSDL